MGALGADPVDRPVDARRALCRAAGGRVALLVRAAHDKEEWVYMPVMESVAEGLRRFDANASVAYADASVSVDIPGTARALRATTGRKTLVILGPRPPPEPRLASRASAMRPHAKPALDVPRGSNLPLCRPLALE